MNSKQFTLVHGLTISILLHLCVAVLVMLLLAFAFKTSKRTVSPLQVELFGMVTNRQTQAVEQKVNAVPHSEMHPKDPRREVQKPNPAPSPDKPIKAPLSPSSDEAPDSVRLSPSMPPVQASSGAQSRSGGDTQQVQQTIAVHNDLNSRKAAYGAEIARLLNSHPFYPQEAKKKKLEGETTITFTILESGDVKPNSLMVTRSSGIAMLDAAALRIVSNLGHFPKPPTEMSIEYTEVFETDR